MMRWPVESHFGACALRNAPSTIAQIKAFFYKRKKKSFIHCFCKVLQSRWKRKPSRWGEGRTSDLFKLWCRNTCQCGPHCGSNWFYHFVKVIPILLWLSCVKVFPSMLSHKPGQEERTQYGDRKFRTYPLLGVIVSLSWPFAVWFFHFFHFHWSLWSWLVLYCLFSPG